MRVKFQDEEFIPAVSTGKYIVVTQHFDSPILDNVDMESSFTDASHYHTLKVPPSSFKSPSRLKYPQYNFLQDPHVSVLQQTPTKSILRKSSYPVMATPVKSSRASYSERGIRAFDWSIRNDAFSKSFDLPDKEADSNASAMSSTATDHEQLVNLVEDNNTLELKQSSIIKIYENRMADFDFYWTDSDSEPLFTAPQSPMSIQSIQSKYLDAESSDSTPVKDKSQTFFNILDTNKNVPYSPCSSYKNERNLHTAFSSLDSNDNIKLPSLDTPSPDSEVSCPIFTFADIHAAPTALTKKIQELSLEMNESEQSPLLVLKEFQGRAESDVIPQEYIIESSSDDSKNNDEDTDVEFSFIESITENSSEPVASAKTEYFSECGNLTHSETESSKYFTLNVGTDLSEITQNDASISSNMVTCQSEDSLQEISIAVFEQHSDQKQSISSCCPLWYLY